MYCAECAFSLPAGAKFCPRCSKRNVLAEAAPGSDPEETPRQDEEAMPAIETGPDANGDASPASDEPGSPRRFVWEALEPKSPPPAPALSESVGAEEPKPRLRYANAGSITLGAAALICMVLGAIQGFIPIFLIEGAAFGGLAWLCAARWPLTPLLHSIVLVSSLILAVLVGVTLDQDTFGPRYRYLSQGSVQYRVDEKAGRTDRLGNGGWYPVAFDKAAEQLPPSDVSVFDFALKDGHWGPNWPSGDEICFTFENSSGYVIQKLSVQIEVKDKDGKAATDVSQVIDLAREGGGLIDTGGTSKVCALAPGNFPQGGSWSYTDVGAYGWKR